MFSLEHTMYITYIQNNIKITLNPFLRSEYSSTETKQTVHKYSTLYPTIVYTSIPLINSNRTVSTLRNNFIPYMKKEVK